jgi:hypothetical protein
MNTIEKPLPTNIATQLANLEDRHKRHQAMLYAHHEAKHDRRARHRARHFQRKIIPILYI